MSLRRVRHRIRSYAHRIAANFTHAQRRRHLLLWSATIPAMVVLLSVVLLLVMLSSSASRRENWYAQNAIQALAQGDAATARLCYASLLQTYPDNPQYQFGLAMALLKLGDPASAATLIRRLAPEDADGFIPAHLYMAEQLLAAKNRSAEALRSAEGHLTRYLKSNPKSPRANALLGTVYSEQGKWEEASPLLALAGPSVGEMGLVAAEELAKRGRFADATAWVRRAIIFYTERLEKNPKDNDARIKLAQAHLMMREYEPAIEVLQKGWSETKYPAFARGIAHAYGLWVTGSSSMDPARRVIFAERGLKWDGQNQVLLESLLSSEMNSAAEMIMPTTQPVEGATLRALVMAVKHARVSADKPLRSDLGLVLNLGGDSFVPITANLGCVWAYGVAEDRKAAGRLTGALMELLPQHPVAERAHGLVLAKQGDWQTAASLLEKAVANMPTDAIVHEALADAYEHLGKPELASQHRALATSSTQPATRPSTAATGPGGHGGITHTQQ